MAELAVLMLRLLLTPNRGRAMPTLDRSMPQRVVRCLHRATRQTWILKVSLGSYVDGQGIGNSKAVNGIRERKRYCHGRDLNGRCDLCFS
ncbi:hypothetical protein C8D77_11644 [Mesorhizobium loti]|uniref:Uncharacterized protein n=1 Tax=Rhizobium loti TaxID=381 RepID=A0A8E3B2Q2_RHILI|nr:hypothetical protein [Mesorhizobium loti]PWJ87468.1 hypothetical protein C8D77_11644 [Mesorhizobium loti]